LPKPRRRERSVGPGQPETKRNSIFVDEQASDIFEAAKEAAGLLKKTFEHWLVIGKAVTVAREIADREGGRQTFMRLIEQQGLGKVVDKATASRLLRIMRNLDAVRAWRETLTEGQQIDWAGPRSICRRCPALKPPPKPRAAKAPARPDEETAISVIQSWQHQSNKETAAFLLKHMGTLAGYYIAVAMLRELGVQSKIKEPKNL
jgi:hypothetical protein